MDSSYKQGVSQKLLNCTVISKDSKESQRFIELEQYKLWSYMMFHKHGLRIGNVALWLWLGEEDYKEREELYSLAHDVIDVNKLTVFLYDQKNGFSHISSRYVEANETEKMVEILTSHVSEDLVNTDNFEIYTETGHCIKNNTQDADALVLGLSEKDDRFWYREQ